MQAHLLLELQQEDIHVIQQAIHNMSIEEIEHLVFTAGEKAERSVRPTTGQGQAHKKKKKNKK